MLSLVYNQEREGERLQEEGEFPKKEKNKRHTGIIRKKAVRGKRTETAAALAREKASISGWWDERRAGRDGC